MTGETQIDVTVKLDAAGKATDAQVTSAQGAAARLVTAEAIKAARAVPLSARPRKWPACVEQDGPDFPF